MTPGTDHTDPTPRTGPHSGLGGGAVSPPGAAAQDPPTRPAPDPTATHDVRDLDADLNRAVRHTGHLRRGFYLVVLIVALTGQVSAAVTTLHLPLIWAIPAVGALELGGIVVLANADVRRRLGERALGSRVLSAVIAAAAAAFNWLAHPDHLPGGFFAGMSLLGYLVWVTHAENSRRDRLRALGALPPTTPAYQVVGHWLRHPRLTHRARSLATANPRLGLYESLTAARTELHTQRRRTAIAAVLHRKIRAAVDPTTADIAVAVYDLDEIADRLTAGADYDALTAIIAHDLTPTRLTAARPQHPQSSRSATTSPDPHTRHPEPTTPTLTNQLAATPPAPVCAPPTSAAQPPKPATDPRPAPPSAPATAATPTTSDIAQTTNPAQTQTVEEAAPKPAPSNQPAPTPEAAPDARPTSTHHAAAARRGPQHRNAPAQHDHHHGDTTDHRDDDSDRDNETHSAPRETAAAVVYWYQREPHLHPRELAARIGRSERTVRRHWPPHPPPSSAHTPTPPEHPHTR